MTIADVVSSIEADMEESQNERDKRVEELWRKLDPQGKGELDFKGLQRGLRRIDHPMKNADDLLKAIVKKVDTSGDGKIQYEEFRVFVETAERQLWLLFRSIDRNQDGRLHKDELQAAFQKAGLAVPNRRLSGFFDEIDNNRDGYISFKEWRDFLLFMPTHGDSTALETALSFYSSIVTTTAEGDSVVSDETLEGLGTTSFLIQTLFGSLLKLAQPQPLFDAQFTPPIPPGSLQAASRDSSTVPPSSGSPSLDALGFHRSPPATDNELNLSATSPQSPSHRPQPSPHSFAPAPDSIPIAMPTPEDPLKPSGAKPNTAGGRGTPKPGHNSHTTYHTGAQSTSTQDVQQSSSSSLAHSQSPQSKSKRRLTRYLPDTGYFLAGAIAGGASRTATAPLDRLKVYLLVNTKSSSSTGVNQALNAAKKGQAGAALHKAGRPITDAVTNLYRAGGVRTFFAGNGLNVIKIMPETAIKFGSYEAAKKALASFEGHGDPGRIKPWSKFAAGGLAGMVSQFFVYPLDTLKFRMQCETVQGGLTGNALIIQTAKKMYASGGVRAAYRGVTMGLVGMFPYSAIDMGTFELLKSNFRKYKARYYGIHEEDAAPGNVVTAMIGASSGAFGASVVYPLNVLRTRLQTQGTVMHPPTYTGIWDVAQQTIRNEGIRGLYKGLTPNLLKVAPALSITWVVYENSKKVLGLH